MILLGLNDETRSKRENSNGNLARSYIYVSRESNIQAFTEELGTDGRSMEEFIEEVERVSRSREQTTEEQCDF